MKSEAWILAVTMFLASMGGRAARAASVQHAASVPPNAKVSSNWAGYVVSRRASSRSPFGFTKVSGRWVLPTANCGSTSTIGPTSSAFWVGLGGGEHASGEVEQAGTEADCSATGVPNYFAWYELAPHSWVHLRLDLEPGNAISASVTVLTTHITIVVRDVSRRTSISKTLRIAVPDTSSAEWIVEAPSRCTTLAFCGEQMLTNFGTIEFSDGTARSGAHSGPISDGAWIETPVWLHEGGEPYGGLAPEQNAAEAVPSALTQEGTAFSVSWRPVSRSKTRSVRAS